MYLHFFNPGYEPAVLLDKRNYTPPANVQRMRRELSLLPLWYAAPEDYVWVEELPDLTGFDLPERLPQWITRQEWETGMSSIPELAAAPWGLSPAIIHFYEQLQTTSAGWKLIVPSWNEEYRKLTSRETAAVCLGKIKEFLPGEILPDIPLFVSSVNEMETYIATHTPPFVVKTPFSSSGRGLLWISDSTLTEKEKQWISGALLKQKVISIEKGLHKVQDFAMEFYLDNNGKATYQGLSVFTTDHGAYNGNILAPQPLLEQMITSLYSPFSMLHSPLITAIESLYGNIYSGYIGIDMMVYQTDEGTFAIHPCIEINMRNTMGMVAIRLFERFIDPDASGYFFVTYSLNAYSEHKDRLCNHPPKWKNGRLRKGYLPLCPIGPQTRYQAYVLIR